MKTLQYILIAFISVSILISCEKEIEFNGDTVEPMIVVNSFISPDSLIYAHLTKSKFFLSNKNGFDFINNADVSLYINQVFKEKLTLSSDGMYMSATKPNYGDTIRLQVKSTGFDDVESTAIIPVQSVILALDTTMIARNTYAYTNGTDTMAIDQNGDLNFRVRIKDPAGEQNYYRLLAKRRSEWQSDGDTFVQEYFISFVLEGFEGPTGGFLGIIDGENNSKSQHLITDELFDGKEFVLRFKTDYSFLTVRPGFEDFFGFYNKNNISEHIVINLQTISKDMYLYLLSRESAERVLDGVFTEPVQIYNNIRNGIGILGSYTNNKHSFKLEKRVE